MGASSQLRGLVLSCKETPQLALVSCARNFFLVVLPSASIVAGTAPTRPLNWAISTAAFRSVVRSSHPTRRAVASVRFDSMKVGTPVCADGRHKLTETAGILQHAVVCTAVLVISRQLACVQAPRVSLLCQVQNKTSHDVLGPGKLSSTFDSPAGAG